jgi:hypothetical protein
MIEMLPKVVHRPIQTSSTTGASVTRPTAKTLCCGRDRAVTGLLSQLCRETKRCHPELTRIVYFADAERSALALAEVVLI